MMNLITSNSFAWLGALPPLTPVLVLLFICNLLPEAPGEEDAWAVVPVQR